MVVSLVERYPEQIVGVLSCFDRQVITGTLPEICHAEAMSTHLRSAGIRIFDYTKFAEPLREEIREHSEGLAAEAGLSIEFIRRKNFRKEDRVKEILQFYYNGHNRLAGQLKKAGIGFQLVDNAFIDIEDFEQAQRLADDMRVDGLHRILDRVAAWLCPVSVRFKGGYHWSLMQIEYATDIIFRSRADLEALYEVLVRTAIHTVKPDNVATFLGRKLDERSSAEIGNDFHTRIEGTRIKHHMGSNSIKMYDKLGRILRIETTSNDVTSFKHHRRVEHRDGTWEMKNAPVRKTIYSLPDLQELMRAANRRYLEFLAALEDPTAGIKNLEKISKRVHDGQRTQRGFNLFDSTDRAVFEAIIRGELDISGFQNRHLQAHLPGKTTAQIARILKRLRTHGLVKKIGRTYRYYLTQLGQRVVCAALKLRRLFLIPALAQEVLA